MNQLKMEAKEDSRKQTIFEEELAEFAAGGNRSCRELQSISDITAIAFRLISLETCPDHTPPNAKLTQLPGSSFYDISFLMMC